MACILQHVPCKERLTSCALVCRAWAAAAVTVPAALLIQNGSSERCMQLHDWLRKHGGAAVRITAQGWSRLHWKKPVLQLPIPKLTQLQHLGLSNIHAELPQGVLTRSRARRQRGSALTGAHSIAVSSLGDAAAAAGVLPHLQGLKLCSCVLSLQLLRLLLSATALTKLHWKWVGIHSDSPAEKFTQQQVLAAVWQQLQLLPKLSVLQLDQTRLTAADVTPVSNLQCLKHLSVGALNRTDAATVAAVVPAGLTALNIDSIRLGGLSAIQAEVSLARFIHLQSYSSKWVCTSFSTLASITGLQQLCLDHPIDSFGKLLTSPAGVRVLLAALQHLTQLRHLELVGCYLSWGEQGPGGCQCFSALTASTQLTALILEDSFLPKAAFHYVFHAGRTLPHLESLCVSRTTAGSHRAGSSRSVEAAEIARIAASCPALRQLRLWGVTPKGFDNRCLAVLPAGVTRVEGFSWVRWVQPAP